MQRSEWIRECGVPEFNSVSCATVERQADGGAENAHIVATARLQQKAVHRTDNVIPPEDSFVHVCTNAVP
jgi:hypothetical protein